MHAPNTERSENEAKDSSENEQENHLTEDEEEAIPLVRVRNVNLKEGMNKCGQGAWIIGCTFLFTAVLMSIAVILAVQGHVKSNLHHSYMSSELTAQVNETSANAIAIQPPLSDINVSHVEDANAVSESAVQFGEARFQRVCAPVFNSNLCLNIRYPFDVTPQSPYATRPDSVDPRFYELDGLFMIDGDDLDQCINMTGMNLSMEETVQKCLDRMAETKGNEVIAIFTRRQLGEENEFFYGTGSEVQKQRMNKFFDRHVIMVIGASPVTGISQCLTGLWGNCKQATKFGGEVNYYCGKRNNDRSLLFESWDMMDAERTYMGKLNYYIGNPSVVGSLTDFLLTYIKPKSGWNTTDPPIRRQLSLILEFPFAHSQHQDMIISASAQVRENQETLVREFMDVASPGGRGILAENGFELSHTIVFDGLPQHFPTETSGYHTSLKKCMIKDECTFYPSWKPEYGDTCVGPVPPMSQLKAMNDVERDAFGKSEFDMRLYGRTWEFANQFWWQHKMWDNHGLDCTHFHPGSGGYCMHKYFLQAMVDGHFESQDI